MAAKRLDAKKLGTVFQARPDILKGIKQAADTPDRVALFNEIAQFVHEQLASLNIEDNEQPASKRRRVEVAGNGLAASKGAAEDEEVLLEVKDISVSVPQRKKYDLCFTKTFLYARTSGTSGPVQNMVYAWDDLEHAFFLPVPDKSQVQHNYVLLPRNSYLPSKPGLAASGPEPLVFTVPATAPKPGSIGGPLARDAAAVSDSYPTLLDWALAARLPSGLRLVSADARVFSSAARQAYRPQEKAVHVKAFRGSKDGFLYFLPTGILWAFKKPLVFVPLERIVAVSYTSVLQRTFNMVIEWEAPDGETHELEFAMLDQEDYQGIDETYVRRHGLADRSMADGRRVKPEATEKAKKDGGADEGQENGAAADGMTELERAHREAELQLQDEEDEEEEEDYDPGSEGESEGSGTSDEEDGEDGEEAEVDDDEEEDEE